MVFFQLFFWKSKKLIHLELLKRINIIINNNNDFLDEIMACKNYSSSKNFTLHIKREINAKPRSIPMVYVKFEICTSSSPLILIRALYIRDDDNEYHVDHTITISTFKNLFAYDSQKNTYGVMPVSPKRGARVHDFRGRLHS